MNQTVEEILEHHGVKGMRWGIRNKPTRKDKKWGKHIYSISGAVDIHNNVADKMNNGGLDRLNSRYKNLPFDDMNNPRVKKYLREYERMNEVFTRQAVAEVHGTSPSGNFKATLDTSDPAQWKINIVDANAKHAADSFETLVMELEHEGVYITLVKNARPIVSQSDLIDDFLDHHGVKGQKWGIRNKSRRPSSSDFRKTSHLRGKPAHQLTNKQLKNINERLNLEQNYKRMNPSTAASGKAKAAALLGTAGLAVTAYNTVKSPAGQALIKAGKTFISTGALLAVLRRKV